MVFFLFANVYKSWIEWANLKFENAQVRIYRLVEEPNIFISGAAAGVVGRSLVLPIDNGGSKGVPITLMRQAPRMGALLAVYMPTSAWNQRNKRTPQKKMKAAAWTGFVSGASMRILTNPFLAIRAKVTTERNWLDTAKHMYVNEGYKSFWRGQHPIVANGLYYGALFACLEGFRGAFHNHVYIQGDFSNAVVNGISATGAATLASLVTYPYSKWRYEKIYARESAVSIGRTRAVLKEAPQLGAAIFTFSLMMPQLAPHWENCGFGK